MKAKKDKSIQTLPWESHRKVISRGIPVSLTAPEHFSAEQINKLESRFSHQKWPDKTDIIIIGMESNLLAEEVEVPYTLWIFPEISGLPSMVPGQEKDMATGSKDSHCFGQRITFQAALKSQELLKLNSIKSVTEQAEYEECIEAIDRGQKEAVYLSGKLAATIMEPETIRYHVVYRQVRETGIFATEACNVGLDVLTELIHDRQTPCKTRNFKQRGDELELKIELLKLHNKGFTVGQLTDTVFLNKKDLNTLSCISTFKAEELVETKI
ncbi:hypothetical protein P5673_031161 [Acropora cervicornis]|uniref:Uncharacterized protein n=1 Tax=Acropora cervicornis TaxID=6130 RepID=A0AAD9PT77_ACRCE|nr:hypothetical protein P5673_031161 [Acropora cervicornis]